MFYWPIPGKTFLNGWIVCMLLSLLGAFTVRTLVFHRLSQVPSQVLVFGFGFFPFIQVSVWNRACLRVVATDTEHFLGSVSHAS